MTPKLPLDVKVYAELEERVLNRLRQKEITAQEAADALAAHLREAWDRAMATGAPCAGIGIIISRLPGQINRVLFGEAFRALSEEFISRQTEDRDDPQTGE